VEKRILTGKWQSANGKLGVLCHLPCFDFTIRPGFFSGLSGRPGGV
jgi:hypothetical protein